MKKILPNEIAIPNDYGELLETDETKDVDIINNITGEELLVIKKSETDGLSKLSAAEKRRYDDIVTIQKYLSEGYAPVTIRRLLHTTYNRIRRYAKGDPYKMCRFHIHNAPKTVNTPKYRTEIIDLLKQNIQFKEIHKRMIEIGCNAKKEHRI